MIRQKITPFLWFDSEAEEAAKFYVSLFPNSTIKSVTPGPAGNAFVVEFELAGIQFIALNGGPGHNFTDAISLSVDCESQDEVDRLWEQLSQGGSPGRCGWLKDKYGLSWQIVPSVLPKLMSDSARRGRVMQSLMGMTKLNIQQLQNAFDGVY